jgi:hypothetical protein
MCIFFHKWGKWQQYEETGTMIPGMLTPKENRGKTFNYSDSRQKRTCVECGRVQDELV